MRLPFLFLLGIVVSYCSAAFDPNSKNNVVVYYGQGPYQGDLIDECQKPEIDVIVVSFVHLFPAQANGYPGTNFGNRCGTQVYPGPGFNGVIDPSRDQLKSNCPTLNAQIPVCQQQYGKKIILSLGGGAGGYQLTGRNEGELLATYLWKMFGPKASDWTGPRPFDSNGQVVEVDGFDMDIEYPSIDNSEGYIALVTLLRTFFQTASKQYYLTGAPQCIVPDANMAAMISATQFDMIFVQFYNTPACSAATWAASNPSYTPGQVYQQAGFTYDAWAQWLSNTPSRNAKLFITLPAAQSAANPGNYITHVEARNLINAYYCRPSFGGIAVWEATRGDGNPYNGKSFQAVMKDWLLEANGSPLLTNCEPVRVPLPIRHRRRSQILVGTDVVETVYLAVPDTAVVNMGIAGQPLTTAARDASQHSALAGSHPVPGRGQVLAELVWDHAGPATAVANTAIAGRQPIIAEQVAR